MLTETEARAKLVAAFTTQRESYAKVVAFLEPHRAEFPKEYAAAQDNLRIASAAEASVRESFRAVAMEDMKVFAANIASVVTPLITRIVALEHRLRNLDARGGGGGTVIRAETVVVDGMEHVAKMLERLDATWRMPSVPIFGKDGMLIGSRKVRSIPGVPPDEEPAEGSAAVSELEARIKALEKKPHLKYVGTWSAERQYNEGDIATDSGSMWHCNRSTSSARGRPGTSSDWVLCVKHGRDAR